MAYRWLLEEHGFLVAEATDGTDALRFLRQHTVDLILTDLYMPEMDGLTLLRQLREIPSPPRVIAMSGSGNRGREAALEAACVLGADVALRKPISGDLLVSTILSLLPPEGLAAN
jgi:CheY-like chemotaxis protein